ncbi:MAG: hypothetical protein QOF83_3249 [Solirubrobacteraceae bacterium]|jgi:hypothetical protein|nr:hypothetical protein [Solirubrobacteraceae bacterium]
MASTGASDEDELRAARVANRFDIRRLIGGVFLLYGLILVALGLFGSHEVKNKADGINVDLWTGIGMLVFGALMVFWALSRPTVPEPPETRGEGSGRIRRAPAT